ncbi:MAG: hypothetical protein M1G31_31570 [Pseudanabaena sp. Salubria-1]|nr:hypothetical protein [Pseudanabaena sp. Salubria-1]
MGTVPKQLTQGKTVIVLADTEFSTVKFFNTVRAKTWRIVVGVRNNRKLQDAVQSNNFIVMANVDNKFC